MAATKKTRIVPTSSTIRLDDGEVLHVGVDAHKATYHVALLSDRRGFLSTWVQPADPELLASKLKPFRDQVARVVSEAGPTGFTLTRRLRDAGLQAEVIAPSKTPTLRGTALDPELRFCLDVLLDEYEHAREQVGRVTRRLDELMRAERHREAVGLLRTVPGVGPVTAMTFRVELPAPERFTDGGQVARMVGLA